MAQSLLRVNFSEPDRAELWRQWRAGNSISDIARVLRREPGTVHTFLSAVGGISPTAKVRSEWSLSLNEREEISRGLSAGVSVRRIAASLGRPPSTVSREVRRNGGRTAYRATEADSRAWSRARRPKVCKLSAEVRLQALVTEKLELDWSPEQVAGWLRVTFPRTEAMQVSHETIYRTLFIQSRGALKRELVGHLLRISDHRERQDRFIVNG